MAELASPDDALDTGSVLEGRYRIHGVIGGGGMARVYSAEHLKIARPVAIKVLHAGLSRSRDAVARFQREATTSGRLVHPNIVTVTDFGILPDGRSFLVMEALAGETLADRLDREDRLPWRTAIDLLGELLLGLRHAHEHGVVHRDIKPENIFLVRGEARPRVKILDFGIAKLYESMPDGQRITQSGLTIGTPIYMSPEQAVDGEITPASDLYSSTVVLFEMLTGEPPFRRDDPIATMKAHLHKAPPRLCDVAPELELPEQLEAIVARGLAKPAIERIPSAERYIALLDELKVAGIMGARALRRTTEPPAGERAAPVALAAVGSLAVVSDPTVVTPAAGTPVVGAVALAAGAVALAAVGDPTVVTPAAGTPVVGAGMVARPAAGPPVGKPLAAAALTPAEGQQRVRETDTMLDAAALRSGARRRWLAGALLVAGITIAVAYRARGSQPSAVDGPGEGPPPSALPRANAPAPAESPAAITAAPPAAVAGAAPSAAAVAAPSPAGAPPAGAAPAGGPAPHAAAPVRGAAEAERLRDRDQVKRWVAEGNAALAAGSFDVAGAQLQRAIAADPAAHAAHAGLAEVAYNKGDFTRAVLAARRAAALAPRVAAYRMTLAKSYYKLLRYGDAIAEWQKVLELEPSGPSSERASKNIEMARAKQPP